MAEVPPRTLYSIAMVSKLSGVSCHALRAWERRYGFPIPVRSATGQRRYVKDQVEIIRQLAKLAASGHPIGALIAEYQAGRLALQAGDRTDLEEHPPWSRVVELLVVGKLAEADDLLDRISERLTPLEAIERLIEPVLVNLGERWFRGEIRMYQERFATTRLLGRLEMMLGWARRDNPEPRHTVVVGAVEGERHTGGLLMISVALEMAGCRALPIGVDVPVEEFHAAVQSWGPDAAAFSFVLSRSIQKRFEALSEIRDVPVFVGGRSVLNHQKLARSHGLIPLTGPLRLTVVAMVAELDRRRQDQR
jgi:methanogenic corrinoid protein MtbC1